MPRICHVFDESTGWEQRVAAGQLVSDLPSDRFSHDLVAIEPGAVRVLKASGCVTSTNGSGVALSKGRALGHYPIALCARRFGLNISAAVSLRAHFADVKPDLVHAWGVNGAVAARAATNVPVAVSLFDPVLAVRHVKALRTLLHDEGHDKADGNSGGAKSSPLPDGRGSDAGPLPYGRGSVGIACSCEIVRRRLVEGGLEEQRTVLIRPGVEFAAINAAARSDLRERLGVARNEKLVIVPFGAASTCVSGAAFASAWSSAASHDKGLFDTAWAVTLLNHMRGGFRIILPAQLGETRTITRFLEGLPTASPVVYVGDGEGDEGAGVVPFEELVAVSDVLVVPARGDTSTTAIAWAMASKTAVIGSAVYSVAELLANKVNGLLFKPPRGKSMTVAIAKLLGDDASLAKVRETARGQAYEVFGLRRFVDDYRRFYRNLLSDTVPSEGITDPAWQAG
jgi:hypothetical protein